MVKDCRVLARQFREKVAAHQVTAAVLVGHSFVCPFDLNVLRRCRLLFSN
jgi:hypothetical protein